MLTIKPLILRLQGVYQSSLLRELVIFILVGIHSSGNTHLVSARLFGCKLYYVAIRSSKSKPNGWKCWIWCWAVFLWWSLWGESHNLTIFSFFCSTREQRAKAALTIQKYARRYLVQKKYRGKLEALRKARLEQALNRVSNMWSWRALCSGPLHSKHGVRWWREFERWGKDVARWNYKKCGEDIEPGNLWNAIRYGRCWIGLPSKFNLFLEVMGSTL